MTQSSITLTPEVVQALTGLAVAAILCLVAAVGVATAKLKMFAKRIQDGVDATQASSQSAATDAAIAREHVANTHPSNLRDDIDALARSVNDLKDLVHSGLESSRERDEKARDEMEGLREDFRSLRDRHDRAIEVVHDRISKMKTRM